LSESQVFAIVKPI